MERMDELIKDWLSQWLLIKMEMLILVIIGSEALKVYVL